MLSIDLPPVASSATRARHLARQHLKSSIPNHEIDDVALVVTELVTNAVLHARTLVRLVLETRDGSVRIVVEDRSDRPAARRDHDPTATTGRGLEIVEQLADSWGVDATAHGKQVWCVVATTAVRLTAQ